jgi:hypothetical protein
VLKRARIRALHEGTSVSAVLRSYLEGWSAPPPAISPIEEILAISERCSSGSGPGGRTWTREDLYDR